MRLLLATAAMVWGALLLVSPLLAAEPKLPAQVDGFLLAPVDGALAQQITDAQDGKDAALTIAVDGAPAEALTVAPERLRDYQNVYYRVTGGAGAWRLEERAFSPNGADAESRLIRRALGISAAQEIFFLPGREHLLVPAATQVLLRAGGQTWRFRAAGASAPRQPTRAVVIREGQAIPLALTEAFDSRAARAGASVAFTVADDVVVDGLVAVAKGTGVEARVQRVQPPAFPGNPGRVLLQLSAATAADGTAVPLVARLVLEGQRGFFLGRGRHLRLAAGTRVSARVARGVAVLCPVSE